MSKMPTQLELNRTTRHRKGKTKVWTIGLKKHSKKYRNNLQLRTISGAGTRYKIAHNNKYNIAVPSLKRLPSRVSVTLPFFPAYYFQAPTSQARKRFAALFLPKGKKTTTTADFRFTWSVRTQ